MEGFRVGLKIRVIFVFGRVSVVRVKGWFFYSFFFGVFMKIECLSLGVGRIRDDFFWIFYFYRF